MLDKGDYKHLKYYKAISRGETKKKIEREIPNGADNLSERTRHPSSQSALLVSHVKHLHLSERVISSDPDLSLATLDPVHKLLQLVSVRHPPVLAGQMRKLGASVLPSVDLVGLLLLPLLDNPHILLLASDLVLVLDIYPVPEDAMDVSVYRHLPRPDLLLRRGKRVVGDHDFS